MNHAASPQQPFELGQVLAKLSRVQAAYSMLEERLRLQEEACLWRVAIHPDMAEM